MMSQVYFESITKMFPGEALLLWLLLIRKGYLLKQW